MRMLLGRNKKLRFSISINHYLKDYGLSVSINYKDHGYSKNISFVIQIWDRHLQVYIFKLNEVKRKDYGKRKCVICDKEFVAEFDEDICFECESEPE